MCKGKVKGKQLFLEINQAGNISHKKIDLPPDTMIGDGIGVVRRFPKLEVGKEFRGHWFDPLSRRNRTVVSKVVGTQKYYWQGKDIKAYIVRSNFGDLTTVSWVTAKGEVLQHQFFFFTFIREPVSKKAKKTQKPVLKKAQTQGDKQHND